MTGDNTRPVGTVVDTIRPVGSVVDTIRAHAARRPDAPAVLTRDTVISYGGLVRRIDRLARTLLRRGLRPEDVCAIAVERGVDAVVAMAAVLHAGGAFLTLDVELPPARLDMFIRSARARFLISRGAFAGYPGPDTALRDDRRSTPWRRRPSSLAYVSHTSGSTGVPNAVLVEHRGLESYLRFVTREYGLGVQTVALQVAPLGYDASIRDTLAPLLAGGRLVMLPRSAVLRAAELFAAVRTYGVNTLLSVTPSFLTFLAGQDGAADGLRPVKLIVSSGESLRPFLAAGGRRVVAGRLVNQYGPTECTMTSTRYAVPAEPDLTADVVGTPIDGVRVYLFGPDLRPTPDGAIGEAYIGGAGVARGYADKPALTADRFLPDPAGPPGARMYRTGDLARWLPSGDLEYLGRMDRQLKIRGHRVDPAEIEGALLAHPRVTGAVVTADTDERGRVFLVAHVAGELAETTDAALRTHLAAQLPPHLMPRRFVRIESVPTTRTGKTDRTALALAAGSVGGR